VGASPAYSFTVHVAELEVDLNSGRLIVQSIHAAHDCGRAINPAQVRGQIAGSVHMGLGEALFERFETEKGLVQAPNLLEYKLPTILDTPQITCHIVERPDAEGPYGAKEAGEGPLHPILPAIACAVYDAIGLRLRETPFSPAVVLKHLEAGLARKPTPPAGRKP
jgi:CO/xanthine dehydrogenase Mo-binding subunit